MLRVKLTEIPRQGLHIDAPLSAILLNERIAKGEESDWQVTADPQVNVHLSLERDSTEAGALLEGEIYVEISQNCRRCLGLIDSQITVPINYVLKPAKEDKKGLAFEEDLGLALYEGDWIELEELLQEAILIAVDPLGAKHKECELPKGVQVEGSDVETGVSLGDFFKSAKKKKNL